jgi:hypothetical protein
MWEATPHPISRPVDVRSVAGTVGQEDDVMVTAIGRQRIETAERWQAALERATDHALDVFAVSGLADTFAVTSASDPSIVYLTTATTCGCPAALAQDEVCQHRAAVRAALGLLEAAPATDHVPATIDCPACFGKGWQYVEAGAPAALAAD